MDNNRSVVVKREWMEIALNIIRFFLQHSTIQLDGMNGKAKVRYHGPNGWNVAIEAEYAPEILMSEETEVLEP